MKILLLNSIVLFAFFIVTDSRAISLSLEEAQNKAISNSYVLQKKISNTRLHKQKIKQAQSALYPHVNIESSYQRYVDDRKDPFGKPILKNYHTSSTVKMTQSLWTFGKVSKAIEISEDSFQISEIDKENYIRELKLNVLKNYYGTLLKMKINQINIESLKNAEMNRKILDYRFQNGRPPQVDILQIESDVLSRKPIVEESTADVKMAFENLKTFFNLDHQETINLTDHFKSRPSIASKGELSKKLDNHSNLIKINKKKIMLKKNNYDLAKNNLRPSLGGFVSYTYEGKDNKAFFSSDNSFNHIGVIGVGLTIPIWNGGEKRAEIGQSYEELKISEYELKDLKKQLNLKLNRLCIKFDSLNRELENSNKFLKIAKETFKMSQNRFKNGQTSILELNRSEGLLTQAKLKKIKNLFDLHIIKAEILELVGEEVIL